MTHCSTRLVPVTSAVSSVLDRYDLTMFTFRLTPTVLRNGKLWYYQSVDEQ